MERRRGVRPIILRESRTCRLRQTYGPGVQPCGELAAVVKHPNVCGTKDHVADYVGPSCAKSIRPCAAFPAGRRDVLAFSLTAEKRSPSFLSLLQGASVFGPEGLRPPAIPTIAARPMPNLENLKKQAKQYLRWRRERYYPVAATIRSFLPRFKGLSDKEILDADFRLGDAQELVARKHGFENWQALIKELPSMTSKSSQPATSVIIAAEPQLFVSDIEASCRFYVDKLGFKVAFAYGEPPFYAQVFRDGGRLNLRRAAGPVFASDFLAREQSVLAATLTLDDAKPLFLEYQARGVAFRQPLKTEPWGARAFIVEDPDGNLICFSGAAG